MGAMEERRFGGFTEPGMLRASWKNDPGTDPGLLPEVCAADGFQLGILEEQRWFWGVGALIRRVLIELIRTGTLWCRFCCAVTFPGFIPGFSERRNLFPSSRVASNPKSQPRTRNHSKHKTQTEFLGYKP